jgi:hypothetical protein
MSADTNIVADDWRTLEAQTAGAKADALDDALAHLSNVEEFVESPAVLSSIRTTAARLREQRSEFLDAAKGATP